MSGLADCCLHRVFFSFLSKRNTSISNFHTLSFSHSTNHRTIEVQPHKTLKEEERIYEAG